MVGGIAEEKGIHVVGVSTDAPESRRSSIVCVEPRLIGCLAGELMGILCLWLQSGCSRGKALPWIRQIVGKLEPAFVSRRRVHVATTLFIFTLRNLSF
jgi:hypothetical protein